jgi:hypothetical protein
VTLHKTKKILVDWTVSKELYLYSKYADVSSPPYHFVGEILHNLFGEKCPWKHKIEA